VSAVRWKDEPLDNVHVAADLANVKAGKGNQHWAV